MVTNFSGNTTHKIIDYAFNTEWIENIGKYEGQKQIKNRKLYDRKGREKGTETERKAQREMVKERDRDKKEMKYQMGVRVKAKKDR